MSGIDSLRLHCFPGKSQAKSASGGESESGESERESRKTKHKKRHHRKRSESRSEEDDGEGEDRRHRRHKRSKHKKDRSDSSRAGGKLDQPKAEPGEETEEQYDARLEREENERLEAERKKHLERLRQQQEEVSTKNGVRFKGTPNAPHYQNIVITVAVGRGRMKYLDPELRRD